MATSNKKSKFQHGSIVRLFLRDFMQYSEVEMKPGPTLNVVIGPNGSGKSSIVNGLALALGKFTTLKLLQIFKKLDRKFCNFA